MLQSMHEKLQGLVAGLIVFLICVTFALWGIQNYLHGGGASQNVAKVNGKKITKNELDVAYGRARAQIMMRHKNFPSDQATQAKLKKSVLKQMINNKVVMNHAKDLGFYVGYPELNVILTGMPVFQVNGEFSVGRFQQVLNNMMYTETQFLNELRETVMLRQMTSGVMDSNFALPSEAKNMVSLSTQKRDIGYVLIPWRKFIPSLKITSQDIQNYYKANQKDFMTKELVSIQYLELKATDIAKGIKTPNDKILKQYYNDNSDLYSIPAKWKMIAVTANNGDDSSAKAAKKALEKIKPNLTTTKATKLMAPLTGGVVTLMRNQMGPSMFKVVETLKAGETSPVFKTSRGLALVKVLKVTPKKMLPFKKVRSKVIGSWRSQRAMEEFADKSSKLSDLTYTNSDNLKVASKELNLPIQTSSEFGVDGAKIGIAANKKVVKVAFSDLVLKQNYNSNAVEISSGDVLVLRVKTHKPSVAKPIAQVKATIKKILQKKLAQAKAKKMANDLFADFKTSNNYSKIVAKYPGARWQVLARKGRVKQAMNGKVKTAVNDQNAITEFAFKLPMPTATNKPTSVEKLSSGDYAVIVALKSYLGKATNPKNNLAAQIVLSKVFGQYEYNLLLTHWLKSAKVKIYDKNLAVKGVK